MPSVERATEGPPSSTEVTLRTYQAHDLKKAQDAIAAGHKRIVMYGPTGYGKGAVAVHMLANCHSKGRRGIFIVDRLSIMDDFSERLDAAGIPHGVIQANHWRNRPWERIQVCSAQTLEGRKMPECDLILWDEVHSVRKATAARVLASDAVVVGFTATPFTKGLGKLFDGIVGDATTNRLISEGHLAPVRVFAGKEIDMRGAKTVAGEWSAKAATERATRIVCDVVETWEATYRKHFGKPVKTICFSSSVAHGEALVEQFKAAGYRFEQVSYKDDMESRRELIDEYKDPDSGLVGLVSVEALAKGFDVPGVKIGIGCRPYRKSLSAFVQSFGRVMRSTEGKEYAVWLDHAGCVHRFMDDMAELFEDGCRELDDGKIKDQVKKEKTDKEKKVVTCSCGTILMPWDKVCPTCGKPRAAQTVVENVSGQMEEVSLAKTRNKHTEWGEKIAWMGAFKAYGQAKGYKKGWAANAYRKRFGVWPNDPRVNDAKPGTIFPEAQGYIRHLMIASAHRRA